MRREITNKDCKLYNTSYCEFLNMQSCGSCFVNDLDNDDAERVISDLQVLDGLLPDEGIHTLFESDDCVLCKPAKKRKRDFYGMLDLAHPEPKRKKRSAIGLKVSTKMGSMVPIQMSVCADCRFRILILEFLPVLIPLFVGIIALITFTLPGVTASLTSVSGLLPLVLFCIAIILALLAALSINKSLTKKFSELTILDPFEIPLLAKMRKNGWFALNTTNGTPKIVFTKKRLRSGAGTRLPNEENERVLQLDNEED